VSVSEQRYEPLGDSVVRFRAGNFVSDVTFETDGLVISYQGISLQA
jgi:hypothetical protein